jgi:DNA-binding response OmpR family regulator
MSGLTILLVDDDLEIRSLITEYLGMVGHMVLEAGSGREAIEIIELGEHSPDLAIVDWQMEGISGREVISVLRNKLPETKVLLATGRGVEDLPESMLSKFACRVLRKPFSMKNLELEIASMCKI